MKRKNLMVVLALLSFLLLIIGGWTWPPMGWKKLHIERNEYFLQTQTGMTIYTVEKKLSIPMAKKYRKAVLLIHGSGAGYGYWDIPFGDYSMMDVLARGGFDVYAVDQRGYGKSTKPSDGLAVSAQTSAEDLESVIDFIKNRANVDKVDLVGHSWGGAVVATLADTYRDNIRNIVLLGFPYKKFNPAYPIPPLPVIIGLPDYVPNTHHLTVEQKLYLYEPEVVAYYKDMIGTDYSLIPKGVLVDGATFAYSGHIPEITAPTLLVGGSREYVVDFNDSANCLSELGPSDPEIQIQLQKDLLVIPNAYHLIFLEEVAHKLQNEAVLRWLTFQNPEVEVGYQMQ